MAPWWLRPTADGLDETNEQGSKSRSGRRGRRSKNGGGDGAAPSEPASLVGVVAQAAEEPDDADPDRGEERQRSSGDASRQRSGRSRNRRGRPRGSDGVGDGAADSRSGGGSATRSGGGDESIELSARGGNVSVPRDAEANEIVISIPDLKSSHDEERKLALFCDLENVARGAKDTGKTFDISIVLERLLEKGKVIVRKAYCDWSRYADYKRPFHEAGIELIEIPQKHYSGKNSADIRMVVDAMDLSYSKEHLDTFVLLSGDSDFSPLVSKLKENNKYVIAVGVKGSTSKILIDACDEFIYYEDIWRDAESTPKLDELSDKEQEMVTLLVDSMKALIRENKDVLWGSMIKQTMQRKRPSFNESYYGYSTFSELLEACEAMGVINLKRDKRSGSYIVTNVTGGGKGRKRR